MFIFSSDSHLFKFPAFWQEPQVTQRMVSPYNNLYYFIKTLINTEK